MGVNVLSTELQSLAGRIVDVDTHEMIPAQEWVAMFGPSLQPMVDHFVAHSESDIHNANSPSAPDYPGDIAEIGPDILNVKGCRAPGAVDPERRLEVMDSMGVSRQLMYGTGLSGYTAALFKAPQSEFMSSVSGDRRALAKQYFGLYNEWLLTKTKFSKRFNPVGLLYGDTVEELIDRAAMLIKGGIRAVWYLPASEAPGGKSPAHPDLDPLWAMLAEANCAFTLHVETDGTPLQDNPWQNAPAFEGYHSFGEVNSNPAFLASLHLPFENFLSIMILGGVFDRHPGLRMGVIEGGAYWVGPMAQRLDLYVALSAKMEEFTGNVGRPLGKKPSEYLDSNVRVTPYYFEDVGFYIEHFNLGKVLCFSTDYPHVEGGRDAFTIFYDKVKRFGSDVVEDFFVNNGTLLIPE